MTPERFRLITELYHAIREGAADARSALLAQADPDLRFEVEALLAEPDSSKFLSRPDDQTLTAVSLKGLAPGACLGPYRIENKLGEGGMGEVFRAIDTRLGRAVAIKTNREQFNPRFEREARAISSLNHPNICTLFDVGPNYLVMELVEGETLAALLKQGPVPVELLLPYSRQIVAALVEAHGKGIVHRDLKPGNIMIGKTGIKVLDFGLARTAEDETVTVSRMIVGTPAYMAPEQREGKATDARADIYAFGGILYEMLTGERAYARRENGQRKRLRARKLETIVSRCLEQDPSRRWQSAVELQQELSTAPKTRAPKTRVPRISRGLSAPARSGSQSASPTLTGKSKIVLGEFENKTGDAIFDGMLRDGLSVQMEQSPSLTVIPDQQIQQTLRYMHRTPDTRLTPDVAQEICERAGGMAVLEGSISRLGELYVISLRARNCRTGQILAHAQVQAEKKEEVLRGLTRIAAQIRARLGESLSTIEEQPVRLEQVTTVSLEALKAYSAARSALYTRGFSAAIPHLQRAIAIDPEIAMAIADLGFFYWNTGQTDLAMEATLKAYALRDRVSDKEKFFILFLYERQVTGNLRKELATIEAWTQAFPQDWHAWAVMGGWGTRGTGQYERGIRAATESLRLGSNLPFPHEGIASHNLSLGRFAEAEAALRRAAELQMEIPSFLALRYYLAFLQGDEVRTKREIERAHGHRESEDWMAHHQALVLARSGQMRKAGTMWHHAIGLAHQNGDRGKAAIYQAAAAVCETHSENMTAAKERARAALELGKGRDVKYAAAFALARAGDVTESQGLAEELEQQFPEDTPVQMEYLPTLRALFALSRKAPIEAIEHLQTAVPYDLAMPGTAFFARFGGLYPVYVRGQAYMEAGRFREAVAEFQRVLDHRGIVLADPIGALAHLQLGRALVLSGEKDEGRRAYGAFLTLWKDADADLPILIQARAEFAKM